jgi:Ca2+-binding RTX toxin-like protein
MRKRLWMMQEDTEPTVGEGETRFRNFGLDVAAHAADHAAAVGVESRNAGSSSEPTENLVSAAATNGAGGRSSTSGSSDLAVWTAGDLGLWHLDNTRGGLDLNVTPVWKDYTGKGVKVAVYDNGVEATHPDLVGNYDANLQIAGNNAAPEANDFHGTAVAGIIAANNDGIGKALGVAYEATIVGVDIWDQTAGPTVNEEGPIFADSSDVSRMTFSREKFDVVNQSWRFAYFQNGTAATTTKAVTDNIALAADQGRNKLGTIVVTAAGNSRDLGWDTNSQPLLNERHSVVVAGVEENGFVAKLSNPGASVLVSAFNSDIPTIDRTGTIGYNNLDGSGKRIDGSDDNYTHFGGTSAAAPQVSGVVALMLEANPNLGWRDVQTILAYSAAHVGAEVDIRDRNTFEKYVWKHNFADNWNGGGLHFSNDYGFGLVDAHAAVRLAETWTDRSTSANERNLAFTKYAGPGSTSVKIPENGSLSWGFDINGKVDLETVEIKLQMKHPRVSDLVVKLTSPEGTVSTLLNNPGKFAGGNVDVDTSGKGQSWTLTSNAFRGESGQGHWTLEIQDVVDTKDADDGQIWNATLVTHGSAPTTDDDYIYTDEFAATSADNPSRQVLRDTDGGIDAINAAALSSAVALDLNAGGINTIGTGFFQIAAGTTIEQAFGGDGNDKIIGNYLVNELRGGRGADFLAGKGDHDLLLGGDGDDVLAGGTDNDILDGGKGFDFSSYYDATAGVTVSLADPTLGTGDAKGDVFISIEGLIGSSYADSLYGDANNNELRGGGGGDTYVVDNDGDQVVELPGEGRDTIRSLKTSYLLGDNVEDLQYTGDGQQAFHGVGNKLDNTISSLNGNDILEGGDGNDTLVSYGWLLGGLWSGNDTLTGGNGDDTLSAGDGKDTFKFADGWGADTVTDFTVGADILDMTGVSGLTSFSQIVDHIRDTADGARIEYAGNSIVLNGVSAASLSAASFTLSPLPPGQTFDGTKFWGGTVPGSVGADTVSYATANYGVFAGLQNGVARGDGKSESLTSIENVTGAANFTNDLQGDANDNVITGGELMDWLRGRGGSNVIDGRGGLDFMDYLDGFNQAVRVDLTLGKAFHSNGTDTLISVEQFRLTNYADTFIGSEQSDYVSGMSGKDHLIGNGGVDSLDGGFDDDWLEGGAEGDYLFDVSAPGGGNDTLDGGAGDDYLAGGFGIDTLIGGAGNDKFVFYSTTDGGDFIQDFASGDHIALSSSGFGLAGTGTLQQAGVQFVQGSAATGAGASIVYDQANGLVYFDQDGTGGAAQQLLAHVTLPVGATLHSSDFMVL